MTEHDSLFTHTPSQQKYTHTHRHIQCLREREREREMTKRLKAFNDNISECQSMLMFSIPQQKVNATEELPL